MLEILMVCGVLGFVGLCCFLINRKKTVKAASKATWKISKNVAKHTPNFRRGTLPIIIFFLVLIGFIIVFIVSRNS